jgi:prolipoprotein diacylglyceryltransferase
MMRAVTIDASITGKRPSAPAVQPPAELLLPRLGRWLDGVVTPTLHINGRSYSTFRLCGGIGLLTAVILVVLLAQHQHFPVAVLGLLVVTSGATFVALALMTKRIVGEERLVYYHHEIAIMLAAAASLRLLRQPVLPYLDILLLGIGTILTIGRTGCLMVGCCHGRPHRFGVCYGAAHAHAGFPACYVGVRLLPIQLVESLWTAGVVAAGIVLLLGDAPAGSVVVWYTLAYGAGRFCFEFARGDALRPYWHGLSEAQWISLLLVAVIAAMSASGALPGHAVATAAAGLLLGAMFVFLVTRQARTGVAHRLTTPTHVAEMAQTIRLARTVCAHSLMPGNALCASDAIRTTSQGIRISAGTLNNGAGRVHHYAISSRDGGMTAACAQRVAGIIRAVESDAGSVEIMDGGRGVFHAVLRWKGIRSTPT